MRLIYRVHNVGNALGLYGDYITYRGLYELQSKLLVFPLISPIILPHIIHYTGPLRSLDPNPNPIGAFIFFSVIPTIPV